MRFGGLIFKKWTTPEEWALAAIEAGYSAVYFPVDYTAKVSVIDGYAKAAKEHNLVICEIGVWNNLMVKDPEKREENYNRAVRQLELADYVGANCCVNIAGSYSEQWDGPHRDNLTEKAFEEIVLTTQKIIDAVNPKHTCYSLEPMPWMYPDTADSYLRLIQSINRKGFAAHLDPVNILCSPQLYYRNGEVIKEWFDKLGGNIVSCHAKDIKLSGKLTVHLDECRPGLGELDYETYLKCVSKLDDRVCLMLEHMTEEVDYMEAAKYIKNLAKRLGIKI
ncbi:TIM barrel protein [Anaerocolumna sedimenticola]|uniref:TIM barrel protein n=1 Tax=Anaerocolumna sedimenticola TaxID=2696063 RepID=A0A6P1TPV3_9FIRM|nr:sugar phosphate isomerase/epimerase [Anaerocolumna sedimenticola]QHQ63270.1 TIM barrel protein [Anaerocolumna sedimenticola]